MTSSKNDKFSIEVIVDDRAWDIIEARNRKNYLCVTSGQSFIIQLRQRESNPSVYGAVLSIDGKKIPVFKTFKNQGSFFGFKIGGGSYKKFLFDVPPLKDSTKPNEEVKKENLKFGTIQIDFYKTVKIMSRKKQKKTHKYQPFQQSMIEDGVKFFERSLAVKEGEIFKPNSDNLNNSRRNDSYYQDGGITEDFIIDYNYPVDNVRIHYSDFTALQIKGVLSAVNIKHLFYIPNEILAQEEYFISTMKTLLKEFKKIHLNDVESTFKAQTKRQMEVLYKYEKLPNFLQKYALHFKIEGGFILDTNPEEFLQNFCIFPKNPSQKYFQKNRGDISNKSNNKTESSFMNSSITEIKAPVSTNENSENKKMEIDDEQVIYLDDDE